MLRALSIMTLRCNHADCAVGSRPYLSSGLQGSCSNQWCEAGMHSGRVYTAARMCTSQTALCPMLTVQSHSVVPTVQSHPAYAVQVPEPFS